MVNIITKEKFLSKDWFIAYTYILIGTFIMAAGYVFFVAPYKFAPGGVYGISIVIHHLTKGIFSWFPEGLPIGAVALSLDIPLTIIGTKILGPRFGVKTVVGFVSLAVFTDLISFWWGYKPLVENQPLLSAIYGGILIGLGLGLVFRSRATSGGSDIIAMIIEKYTKMPLGQLMIIVDSSIVLLTLVAFQDWSLPLLSLIIIYFTGKVVDLVLEGTDVYKAVLVISEEYDRIKQIILEDLDRGGSRLLAKGLYSEAERKIIFTVLTRREVEVLKKYIKDIDPKAFVTIFDAKEILGEGFKPWNKLS